MPSSEYPIFKTCNTKNLLLVTIITTICCSFAMPSVNLTELLPSIKLHEIKFNDLARLDESTALSVQNILSSIGILKITGIPNLNIAQDKAFNSLSSCLASNNNKKDRNDINFNENQIFTSIMEDGTKRLSIGAKSTLGQGGKLSHECGDESSHLRSLVDLGTRQLFQSLDLAYSLSMTQKMSKKASSESKIRDQKDVDTVNNDDDDDDEHYYYLMKPYQSFTDLMDKGEHLEHIHTYYNSKRSSVIDSEKTLSMLSTMGMHTDAGLMIAMTTGYYPSSPSPSSSNIMNEQQQQQKEQQKPVVVIEDSTVPVTKRGLFITLSSGEIAHVDESDLNTNDLIIMIGAAGTEWLSPRFSQPLRAVPHALVVELGSDTSASRNWYGKMFLPPLDAELYQSSSSSSLKTIARSKSAVTVSPVTYKTYRQQELKYVVSSTISSSTMEGYEGLKASRTTRKMMEKIPKNILPVACGQSLYNSPFALIVPKSCTVASTGDVGVMCWAQCMSTSTLNCANDAVPTCTDEANGEEIDGLKMCGSSLGMKGCKLTCIAPPTVTPTSSPMMMNNDNGNGEDISTGTTSTAPTLGPGLNTGTGNTGTGSNDNNADASLSSSDNAFCIGPSGTSMSMTGFISSAAEIGQESLCFVYLFPSWVLDDSIKFLFACLGTIGIGILIHGLSKLKSIIHHYKASSSSSSSSSSLRMNMNSSIGIIGMNEKNDENIAITTSNNNTATTNTNLHLHLPSTTNTTTRYQDSKSLSRLKFYSSILIYFLQIILSYTIMLVAMTYNVELFFMVCIGLTIGYALFHPHNLMTHHKNDHKNDDDDDDEDDEEGRRFRSDDNNQNHHHHHHHGMSTTGITNTNMMMKDPYSSLSSSSLNVHLEPCCQDLDYEAVRVSSNSNK